VAHRPIGKIDEFTMLGTELVAKRSEHRDLGFQIPTFVNSSSSVSQAAESDGPITLSDLLGLAWSIDDKNQELR
jgi:hypothetical protein